MPARFFVEKRKDPDYIPNDPMEIEHVDKFLKLMAVLTGDNRYVDIVKLDGKEIVNMCDVATRLENLGIQKGLAAYQQHLREYKGKTTTAAPSPGEWEETFGDAWILRCGRAASPVWREPPVRTNGATSVCLLSYFAIAGSSPYTSLIERSLAGSTLSISIL